MRECWRRRHWFLFLVCVVLLLGCERGERGEGFLSYAGPVPILLVPLEVEVESGGAGEDLEAWRLFDRDTTSGIRAFGTVRIRCTIAGARRLTRVRLYGGSGYEVRIYADGRVLGEMDGGRREEGWSSIEADVEVESQSFIVELKGDGTGELGELELWGEAEGAALEELLGMGLSEVGSGEELAALVEKKAAHVVEVRGSPDEIGSPGGIGAGASVHVRFDLAVNPACMKRAYLAYRGRNIRSIAGIRRQINGSLWEGGQDVSGREDGCSDWREYIEEINPAWLVRGENVIRFESDIRGASLCGFRLVLAAPSGWNDVGSCSPAELYDGRVETSVALAPEGEIGIGFERPVYPETLMVYLPSRCGGKAALECAQERGWIALGTVDFSGLKAGWNAIAVPGGERCEALRLVRPEAVEGVLPVVISEVRVLASAAGSPFERPRVVVSYPRRGEYFGREAYIQGFTLFGEEVKRITGEGKLVREGGGDSFSFSISKDETRFRMQESRDAWESVVLAEWLRAEAVKAVALYANGDGGENTVSPGEGAEEGEGGFDGGASGGLGVFTTTVHPGSSKSVTFRGVSLEIPAGAVETETRISIIPLLEAQVAPLSEGMVNATSPDAGYRFLFNGKPHGRFRKPILITFAYSRSKLLAGQGDGDVLMYYHDEEASAWKRLERVDSSAVRSMRMRAYSAAGSAAGSDEIMVSSLADHFTDFINATLVVPEHPEALLLNANTISEIRAGDPGAGIRRIDPPGGSSLGDAVLSYPLELPPGRKGVAPRLELRYNSSGGNGWLGLGWDVAVSSVSVNTKFGTPRYDGSETYLLDGQELIHDPERGCFRARVEGAFMRIVRHGDSPAGYHWELVDKGGTRFIYGLSGNSRVQSYRTGHIFQWNLERTIDPNGNTVNYYYEVEALRPPDGEPSVQSYLRRISYTGRGGLDGPFSVEFMNEETARPDVIVNCRGGFKQLMRFRLGSIAVKFNGSPVRRYALRYTAGAFGKSLLERVEVYGEAESKFNEHVFAYYDETRRSGNSLEGFSAVGDGFFEEAGEFFKKLFLADMVETSTLGGSFGTSVSVCGYLGISPGLGGTKGRSIGVSAGRNRSRSDTERALVDIDGDGLADQVYVKTNGEVWYRRNLLGVPDGGFRFGAEEWVEGLSHHVGRESDTTLNRGPEGHLRAVSLMYTTSTGNTVGEGYFSDVNGDGLVDFVSGGRVLYNRLIEGRPVFSPEAPPAAYFSDEGEANIEGIELGDPPPSKEELAGDFYRDDPLLMWRAPYKGMVRIGGGVRLVEKEYLPALPEAEEGGYATNDGVWVSVQKGERALWSATIGEEDHEPVLPSGMYDVWVSPGEELYFRVNSIDDGAYDVVEWDPVIEYIGVDGAQTDENGAAVWRYRASEDFAVVGKSAPLVLGMGGRARITGTLWKRRPTSDDVTVRIQRLGDDGTVSEIMAPYTVPGDFSGIEELVLSELVEVSEGDSLRCLLHSDTPIDWSAVSWKADLCYEEAADGSENSGMEFALPVETTLYPLHDALPASPFTASRAGRVRVRFEAAILGEDRAFEPLAGWFEGEMGVVDIPEDYEAGVRLALKGEHTLHGKVNGVLKSGGFDTGGFVEDRLVLEMELDVERGERLFFVCASEREDVMKYMNLWTGEVTWLDNGERVYVDSSLRRMAEGGEGFSGGHRSWYFGRWNGERLDERLCPANALDPSLFAPLSEADVPEFESITEEDCAGQARAVAEKLKTFSGMSADAAKGRWVGNDPDSWIGWTTIREGENEPERTIFAMSATRVVQKYLPDADDPFWTGTSVERKEGEAASSRARAVKKLTKSSHRALGGSSGIAGASATLGKSACYLDYFDMNGDRFPDIVASGEVQFTRASGALESARRSLPFSAIRKSENSNFNLSLNTPSIAITKTGADNQALGIEASNPSLGFGGNACIGQSETDQDFIDINGDGLPDLVSTSGGKLTVRLNLGYALGAPEVWDTMAGNLRVNRTASVASSLGFSWQKLFWGGGVAATLSQSATELDYVDVNGDGLPDRVRKDITVVPREGVQPIGGAKLMVRLNTGGGFAEEEVEWKGTDPDQPIIYDGSVNQQASLYAGFPIPVPIPFCPFSIIVNPGGNAGMSLGKGFSRFQDVNGDGLADHIYTASGGRLKARLNRMGKTNLLKSVKLPLGGRFELEYARAGNTADMPQSRWVLDRVRLFDGSSEPNTTHVYTTDYAYGEGYYDRDEREFHGFGSVEETRAPGSAVEQTTVRYYHNRDYYLKGLEYLSALKDRQGRVYTITRTSYEKREIVPSRAYFPMAVKKETACFEGGEPGKLSLERYAYDRYGNVTHYTDAGDDGREDTADDLVAYMEYDYREGTHIVSNPHYLEVRGGDGRIYRKRTGVYDEKGNLRRLIQSTDTGQELITDMNYTAEGMLALITLPGNEQGERYRLSYTYDTATASYVEGVVDSFGYASSARYDYRYGLPVRTSDINGNGMIRYYDQFGRLDRVYGPYDASIPALEFYYDTSAFPAVCRTRNYPGRDRGNAIDTLVFTDGLGRVVQVKKSAAIGGSAAMTVSGKRIHDELGRVIAQGQPVRGSGIAYEEQTSAKNPTRFSLDALSRTTRTDFPDGTDIRTAYSIEENAFVSEHSDQEGKRKRTKRDNRGMITGVKEELDGSWISTRYTYNHMGEITGITDAKGSHTEIGYDMLGRRCTINNPDTGLIRHVFDPAGNLIRKYTPNTRRAGTAIKYFYRYNRLEKIDYPTSPDVNYTYGPPGATYNRAGRIASVDNGAVREERFYGRLGETIRSVRTVKQTVPSVLEKSFTTHCEYDNLGRMTKLVYPDGETLSYGYDQGGMLRTATGSRPYLKDIHYDEFGQRAKVVYGNDAVSAYEYDARNRRLKRLRTVLGEMVLQNISYEYDRAGNILSKENSGFHTGPGEEKSMRQSYGYDDLHRLVSSSGSYEKEGILTNSRINRYTNSFSYDVIGNMLTKEQVNLARNPSTGKETAIPSLTYTLDCRYDAAQPHAVSFDGNRAYTYDQNGNMTEYVSSDKKQWRKLYWDDENRLIRTQDNAGTVEYAYDEGGLRSRKKSALGETLYVNLQYSVRNGEVYSKHVFAGNTRLATTMVKRKGAAATELGVYYYHGDHLGSSNVITDRSGQFHEHLEYFPYGETWVHEKAAGSPEYMAHLFTGKELDPETGLYDYGYRYLDPRLGRWASADPALARGDYMPSLKDRLVSERNGEEYQPEESLPGHGGVYNTINIDVYHYAGNNPIRFVDPDGLYLLLVELHKDRSKPGKLTLYDDNGKVLGTFPVRGRGQGRDRMLEKGDTPTGIYLIEDRVSIDQNNDSYSSLGRFFLGLKAFFGEALEAREKGRGIATWRGGSGRIGVHGKGKERINDLVSTYGCLRIKEDDATIIESMIIDIEKERVSRTGQHPKIKDAVMVFEK